jgi:hypothetical protein
MKKFILPAIGILVLVLLYIGYTTIQEQNTQITELNAQLDEAAEVENLFEEYVRELEDDLEMLDIEYRFLMLMKPRVEYLPGKVITRLDTVTVRDTIRVTVAGADANKLHEIPFTLVDTDRQGAFRVKGLTKFRWDYDLDVPKDFDFEFSEASVNLNVTTDINIVEHTLDVDVFSQYPKVRITNIEGPPYNIKGAHRAKKPRLGLGLFGGYGYTLDGFAPLLGVGATYTFIGIRE